MILLCTVATILITGGTGLVGTALTKALLADGHTVTHLGRKSGSRSIVPSFNWDLARAWIDPVVLDGVDHIIHLAGAPIADRRWTKARVRELIDSRAGTARLLLQETRSRNAGPKSFISAAGTGYYGAVTRDSAFTEGDPPGGDTIARISSDWERAVDEWASICRVVKLRTPIVLAHEGALGKLAAAARWGLAAPLGSGTQIMPWVHIDDLVRAYRQAVLGDGMSGAYNVCAAEQPTNREFMRALAKALQRPFFLPAVPGAMLRLVLGELADMILQGSRMSNARLLDTGFLFQHDVLAKALEDLLREKH